MKDPVIYLDVDGCLNPFRAHIKHSAEWNDYVQQELYKYPVWTSKLLGQALLDLGVEIVWATTWVQDNLANTWISEPMGFHQEMDCIAFEPWAEGPTYEAYMDGSECGKGPGVLDHALDSPIIWIDDCLGSNDEQMIKDRGPDLPYLLIRPSPEVGITRDDIETMKQFIEKCRNDKVQFVGDKHV